MTDTKKRDGSDSLHGLVVCEAASDECPDRCRHKAPHKALKEQDYSEICTEPSLCTVLCKDTKCEAHNHPKTPKPDIAPPPQK